MNIYCVYFDVTSHQDTWMQRVRGVAANNPKHAKSKARKLIKKLWPSAHARCRRIVHDRKAEKGEWR